MVQCWFDDRLVFLDHNLTNGCVFSLTLIHLLFLRGFSLSIINIRFVKKHRVVQLLCGPFPLTFGFQSMLGCKGQVPAFLFLVQKTMTALLSLLLLLIPLHRFTYSEFPTLVLKRGSKGKKMASSSKQEPRELTQSQRHRWFFFLKPLFLYTFLKLFRSW